MLQGQGVQLVHRDIEKGGHLVDERPGATGAGAVHPLLQGVAEEDDLGVLAPQLDDRVRAGDEGADGGGGGVDLLDEFQSGGLGHTQAGGAGDQELEILSCQHILQAPEGLAGPLPGLGIMPLIGAK